MGQGDPRPPADPSFVLPCGPSFKNHLTCTGWLATHRAAVDSSPAVGNDRPAGGDPVSICSLFTFSSTTDEDDDDQNADDDDRDRKCSVNKGDWAAASSS